MSRIKVDEEYCKGCGLCVNVCPRKIVTLDEKHLTSKGYHPAGCMDFDKCIGCKFCAMMCPESAIEVERA